VGPAALLGPCGPSLAGCWARSRAEAECSRSKDMARSGYRITFLEPDGDDSRSHGAAAAIVDESCEPYISLLARREAEFMTGEPIYHIRGAGGKDPELRELLSAQWSGSVRAWHRAEKAGICACLDQLYTVLGPYPGLAGLQWRFIKTRRGFCGGMAHTRHDAVVFDEGMCERYAACAAENRARLVGLLAHEQLHVLQRFAPAEAQRFYLELWGGGGGGVRLVLVESLQSCAWLDEHQVTNPDAVHLNYLIHVAARAAVKERWIWPRTVIAPAAAAAQIRPDGAPKPNQVGGYFQGIPVEMEKVPGSNGDAATFRPKFGAGVAESPLASPLCVCSDLDELWEAGSGPAHLLFPAGYAYDHPNEVSAYLFADICLLALEEARALPASVSADQDKADALRRLVPKFSHWLRATSAL
jgi:hypothetical protein